MSKFKVVYINKLKKRFKLTITDNLWLIKSQYFYRAVWVFIFNQYFSKNLYREYSIKINKKKKRRLFIRYYIKVIVYINNFKKKSINS
jgi:hypothetical protein